MAEPRIVHCVKLKKDLPGLERLPAQGELGQRVFDNVSKEGFKMFLDYFKMVVNEYRLDLASPETDKIFLDQMQEFFFGTGGKLPNEYIKPE
jgi:Fe-S cluster biosynthesis and repair protein YggX